MLFLYSLPLHVQTHFVYNQRLLVYPRNPNSTHVYANLQICMYHRKVGYPRFYFSLPSFSCCHENLLRELTKMVVNPQTPCKQSYAQIPSQRLFGIYHFFYLLVRSHRIGNSSYSTHSFRNSFALFKYHCSFFKSCSMLLSGLVPIRIRYLKAVISHQSATLSFPHISTIISIVSIG